MAGSSSLLPYEIVPGEEEKQEAHQQQFPGNPAGAEKPHQDELNTPAIPVSSRRGTGQVIADRRGKRSVLMNVDGLSRLLHQTEAHNKALAKKRSGGGGELREPPERVVGEEGAEGLNVGGCTRAESELYQQHEERNQVEQSPEPKRRKRDDRGLAPPKENSIIKEVAVVQGAGAGMGMAGAHPGGRSGAVDADGTLSKKSRKVPGDGDPSAPSSSLQNKANKKSRSGAARRSGSGDKETMNAQDASLSIPVFEPDDLQRFKALGDAWLMEHEGWVRSEDGLTVVPPHNVQGGGRGPAAGPGIGNGKKRTHSDSQKNA